MKKYLGIVFIVLAQIDVKAQLDVGEYFFPIYVLAEKEIDFESGTQFMDLRELVLFDSISGRLIFDSYGVSCDVSVVNNQIFFSQYEVFDSERVCFSRFQMELKKNSYCISRLDSIFFDWDSLTFKMNELDDFDDIQVLYFLGCLTGDVDFYFTKFMNLPKDFATSILINQLYRQGIIIHRKNPKLVDSRRDYLYCNYRTYLDE